jgi:diacylglycerol kinase (ATP)
MSQPVLIFINPVSGAGLGQQFISAAESIPDIHFVKLPDETETFEETYRELLQNPELRIVSAGGDGTANWVVSLMSHLFPLNVDTWKPPIAICPFGTGNDLSRSLNWGSRFFESDLERIPEFLTKVRGAENSVKLDIWNVTLSRSDVDMTLTKQMLNYFSLGVDAKIAVNFESCRQSCRCCFCCHCMSKTLYVPVGFSALCCQPKLHEFLDAKVYDTSENGVEVERTLEFDCCEKTLALQNIPYIYGGCDLWRIDQPRSMSDGKVEVTSQGGAIKLGLAGMHIYTGRNICQATRFKGAASEPIAYQVDGEGYLSNGPTTFEIVKSGQYPFLINQQ